MTSFVAIVLKVNGLHSYQKKEKRIKRRLSRSADVDVSTEPRGL